MKCLSQSRADDEQVGKWAYAETATFDLSEILKKEDPILQSMKMLLLTLVRLTIFVWCIAVFSQPFLWDLWWFLLIPLLFYFASKFYPLRFH